MHVNNSVLLYSTENYNQYLVITYNGKESEKECVYTVLNIQYIHKWIYISRFMYLNHFAVHQKLTEHCKSTIFQFENKNKNTHKKTKHAVTIWPSSCILRHLSQRNKNFCLHRNLFNSSLIYYSQELEKTQMSFKRRMIKQIVKKDKR